MKLSSKVLHTKHMNTSYPKKHKCIVRETGGTVSCISKRSRMKAASTIACIYKHTQTLLLYNRKSKLKYPSTNIGITNSHLDYNSSFRQVFSPKELVLPTSRVSITASPKYPTPVEHMKNSMKVAEIVKDTEEKLRDEKRKAYFS